MNDQEQKPRTDYTREELVAVCERAVAPMDKWSNRDSAIAHRQLGEAWALLKAGADFQVLVGGDLNTDADTIWVYLYFPGFDAFEYGRSDERNWDDDHFYLPTPERLDRRPGEDWY